MTVAHSCCSGSIRVLNKNQENTVLSLFARAYACVIYFRIVDSAELDAIKYQMAALYSEQSKSCRKLVSECYTGLINV